MKSLTVRAIAVVGMMALGSWTLAGENAPGAPLSAEKLKEARKKAAHRSRRIIMNNDGHDAVGAAPAQSEMVEKFLAARTSPLVGSQVDAIFYCTGVFNYYHHHSKVSQLQRTADRAKPEWAADVIATGRDSLQIMTDFGHEHGMEVFWSMRMNDTHDSGDPTLMCQWKRDHPEYLMGTKDDKFQYGGKRWSAVNYGLPEVREKVFRILEDVCTRYNVDGIELDFFRHPVYFKPQMTGDPVTQAHCDMMTDLLRRLRTMTEETGLRRGRPLLISVRVPDSLGYAKAIGLDVTRWLEDDLVDLLAATCYFRLEPWRNLAALGKRFKVPIYAALSASRLVDPKNPESSGDPELWRGEAMNAWKAGVSGIYTFNRFNPRDPIFRELGSPDTLAGKPMKYVYIPGKGIDSWLKGGSKFLVEGK